MKHLLSIILSLLLPLAVFAQKSVSIVVVGEGNTKEEATRSALRSAIEQSFGAFVSSNTTLLDDELIKDEIVSVSSGNIQNFRELSFSRLSDGHCTISIEATVSLAKLTSFAQSKGSECELAGATFGANLQLVQFYKEAEGAAIDNLIKELTRMLPSMYDYSLNVRDPVPVQERRGEAPSNYKLVFDITISANDASEQFCNILVNTLTGLSMNNKAAVSYQQITGIKPAVFYIDEDKPFSWGNMMIVLRDEENVTAIERFINNTLAPSMVSIELEDNLGEKHYPEFAMTYVDNTYTFQTPREVLDGIWPDMGVHYLGSDHSVSAPKRYSIRYLWKHAKYTAACFIMIPMNDIGKYRRFSIRKNYTIDEPKKKVYQYE